MEPYIVWPRVSGFFTEHGVFEVHPYGSMDQNSIPFHGLVVFHGTDRQHFVYLFICWRALGYFPLLATVNRTVRSMQGSALFAQFLFKINSLLQPSVSFPFYCLTQGPSAGVWYRLEPVPKPGMRLKYAKDWEEMRGPRRKETKGY